VDGAAATDRSHRVRGGPDGHGPGGYWFSEGWKLGRPLLVLFLLLVTFLIPVLGRLWTRPAME
jgi:hypothetical protein